MSHRKRQKTTKISQGSKILSNTTATKFEDLPNELILICFNYFDFYQLYEIFFCLNQRFNKLILYDAKIHVDFGTIPNGKFLTFCFNLNHLKNTSGNYPLSIRADNEHQFNIFFEDDLFKDKFSKLKSLTLNNIKLATLSNIIFDKTIKLYKTLERLSLMKDINVEACEIEELCSNLISSKMKSLKYLNLNFEICEWEHNMYNHEDYVDLNYKELSIRKNSLNSLETIIIGYIPKANRDYSTTRISFYSLIDKLLPCLPKLKNLIINSIYLDESDYQYYQHKKSSIEGKKSVIPSNLKVIKIWTDVTQFKEEKKKLKKLLRNYFMNDSSLDTTTIKIFTINNKNVLKEKF
ncbi:unnamed protein product [Rotaria sordida]|uniref:F-box domain-containing protein n=2 Tax=Rotaria sordida TaxID=392033 RepID=A0A814Y8D6_9BILA|nr:unnamed protein product [Rotaria sordida]CAF4039012.1 unnamed protein product [Rotaria sordida]